MPAVLPFHQKKKTIKLIQVNTPNVYWEYLVKDHLSHGTALF